MKTSRLSSPTHRVLRPVILIETLKKEKKKEVKKLQWDLGPEFSLVLIRKMGGGVYALLRGQQPHFKDPTPSKRQIPIYIKIGRPRYMLPKLIFTFCFWEARFFSSEIFSGLYLMSDGMDTWTGT